MNNEYKVIISYSYDGITVNVPSYLWIEGSTITIISPEITKNSVKCLFCKTPILSDHQIDLLLENKFVNDLQIEYGHLVAVQNKLKQLKKNRLITDFCGLDCKEEYKELYL